MTITVEQLQYAIEEDRAEYPEHTKQVESTYRPGVFYEDGPYNGQGWDEFAHEGGPVVIDGVLYEFKPVASTGGEEQGSNASTTFQVGDQYFRKNGYYASHYGYDWDGTLEEVRPVEKVVTVFE